MDFLVVVNIFLATVDGLMRTRLSGDRKIYMETKEGRYINFKPNSFRKKLQEVAGEKADPKELMRYFRTLQWIVGNSQGKFTNIQRLGDKVMRVITVDREVLSLLKELTERMRMDS